MSTKKPNVIWIFGDQHRAQALGCNGNSIIKTPNINKLAEEGINFNNAVAGFPLCCPFRGSLLTSKYPHECVPGHQYQMNPELSTIADVFNENKYYTAYFGKWHLDGGKEEDYPMRDHIIPPERRGRFQRWIGYENNNAQWNCWVHGGEGENLFHYKLPGYETDELTNLVLDFIKNYQNNEVDSNYSTEDNPFFTILSVQPPHNPYYAPEEYMLNHHNDDETFSVKDIELRENVPNISEIKKQAMKDLAGAYAMIENLDTNVGRIIELLKELEIYDNTIIIFFSDHGDMHGSHGFFRKTSPYEESIRIPFIIGGGYFKKKNIEINRIVSVLLNHVDISPTTLGLCGIEVPNWMDGNDYSRFIVNSNDISEYPESVYLQSVIPTGHYDCIDRPWRGIVTKDGWKYAVFEGMEWLMYDLNKDPFEMVNLAHYSKYRKKKLELNRILKDWVLKTKDKFILPEFDNDMKLNQK